MGLSQLKEQSSAALTTSQYGFPLVGRSRSSPLICKVAEEYPDLILHRDPNLLGPALFAEDLERGNRRRPKLREPTCLGSPSLEDILEKPSLVRSIISRRTTGSAVEMFNGPTQG
jgi:hypothetical protein